MCLGGGISAGSVVGITFGCVIAFMVASLVLAFITSKRRQQPVETAPVHAAPGFDNPSYSGNALEMKARNTSEA